MTGEPDPQRVEELRAELEKDIGMTVAVKSMARSYAREEQRADEAEQKLKAIAELIDRPGCLECDTAAELIEDIKEVM